MVFLAVHRVDLVPVHDDRGIEPAFRELKAPDLFTRPDLHRVHGPVACRRDQEPLTLDDGHHGNGVGRVLRRPRGRTPPLQFSGIFIHRQEAVLAAALRAEAGVHKTEDDLVFVDNRGVGPSAIAGNAPERFGEGAGPENFSIAAKTEKHSLNAVGVYVAGLGIDDRAGPPGPRPRDIGVEDVKAMFPDEFTRLKIQGEDALLFHDARSGAVDGENSAVLDDRCRAPSVGSAPEDFGC